jgi:hydrogenase-1 operon protein HyaF
MKPFPIPVTMFGPGSQPEEDAELHYMQMPSGMHTFNTPELPEPEDVRDLVAGRDALKQALQALKNYREDDAAARVNLDLLNKENLTLVNQLLGLGEVSASVKNETYLVEIQESVFAGVWRVRYFDANQNLITDRIEVGAIPEILRTAGKGGNTELRVPDQTIPGAVNARALLFEIAEQMKADNQHYVINLTLLPFSPEDGMFMDQLLGRGEATILSRGYGNCRITATGLSRVWWVQFFNSTESLILNTIEITDMPEVALAALDDIQDSAIRLAEVIEWID